MMRHSLQPVHGMQTVDTLLSDFEPHLVVNSLANSEKAHSISLLETHNPRILNCDDGKNPEMDPTKCNLFRTVASNMGLAYGYYVPGSGTLHANLTDDSTLLLSGATK